MKRIILTILLLSVCFFAYSEIETIHFEYDTESTEYYFSAILSYTAFFFVGFVLYKVAEYEYNMKWD
jgi:hypothetical protein